MEQNDIKAKVQSIVDRIGQIDKERDLLMRDLLEVMPVKIGEKISIENSNTKKHVRFAFIHKIKVSPRGKEREPKLEFELIKCKVNGEESIHSDYLNAGEYITKIKTNEQEENRKTK